MHRDGATQTDQIRRDPGIEVVYLSGEGSEVELTSIHIESDEAERSVVHALVLTDVHALHEAHVGVEQQRLGAAVRIRSRTRALYLRDPNEAVEVTDG